MRELTQAEVDELNPGIRRLVGWLRANGFDTCDSGDGQTHDHECDRSYPYVTIIAPKWELVAQADRLNRLLVDVGVPIRSISEEPLHGAIQATYDPADGSGVIDLTGVSDKDLPPILVTFKEKINDEPS